MRGSRKQLTRRQKTYLTLSGILLAMGAFVVLMMGLALIFLLFGGSFN